MRRTLAVASGKGGVGKTWFSVSLSQALARLNRRVLLVDCDVGLANVDVQVGLTRTTDLTRVVLGDVAASQAILSTDTPGFDVLPGRSGDGYIAGLDPLMVGWLQGELRIVGDRYDIIVLDLPSGIEQGVRDMMCYADDAIVITTGEPTALTDAYALIKATRRHRRDSLPKIVMNFADNVAAGHQALEGFASVCDRFLALKPERLGVVRRDPRVPEAIGRQTPILKCYPGCDAARDVVVITETLMAAMKAA